MFVDALGLDSLILDSLDILTLLASSVSSFGERDLFGTSFLLSLFGVLPTRELESAGGTAMASGCCAGSS